MKKEVTKPIQESVKKEVSNEVVPFKTCILKRTNKPAHQPRHSPEWQSVPKLEAATPTKS